MGLTPGSDTLDVGGACEVIAVDRFVEPTLLAGGFAGLAALGICTVALTLDTARVRNEDGLTMLTLTRSGWMCHGPVSPQVHHGENQGGREDDGVRKRPQKKIEENGRIGLMDHFGEEDSMGSLTFSTRLPNSIFGSLLTDGKIIGKPSDFGLTEDDEIPPKLLKRIYGELQADGLADDTTADWGAIIENSKGYQQVSEWVRNQLKERIEQVFSREVNLAKARLQQEINRRLAQLPKHRREFAHLALEKVMRRFYGESEERIGVIVSVTLDAFEYDEYWTVLQKIDDATRHDVMTFAEALQAFGLLDMAIMAEQAIRRLTFLDELDRLVQNPTTREDAVHKAIEKNLWVLGADYTLMSSNRTLARTIEEYTTKRFTGTRAAKRPDLLLSQNPLNEYLLIEFKRPSHALNRDDENQAIKYRDDLTGKFGKISILLLGGKRSAAISNQYEHPDLKVMSYEALISQARSQLQWLVQQVGAN